MIHIFQSIENDVLNDHLASFDLKTSSAVSKKKKEGCLARIKIWSLRKVFRGHSQIALIIMGHQEGGGVKKAKNLSK